MPFSKSKLAAMIAALAEEVTYFRDAMRGRAPHELSDEFYLTCIGRAISAARFVGRGGSSEYKVLAAALRIAVEAQTCWPTLPLRRLTSEAGIGSRDTTARALSRLVDAGWLAKAGNTDGLRGNQYWLRIPKEFEEEEKPRKPGPIAKYLGRCRGSETVGGDIAGWPLEGSWLTKHDAFAYGALGSSAARLYIHLIGGSRTRQELVDRTGMHRDTVKRNLKRLVDNRLANAEGTHWRPAPLSVAHLDSIARKYGTAGRHEAQARRHEHERRVNVMRQLDLVTGDKDVDHRDYAFADGGMLVNLQTGELPDVYRQFWWIDHLRLGRVAAPVAAVRRLARKLRQAIFADPLSTLEGYPETNPRYRASSPSGVPRGVATPRSTPSLSARARYGDGSAGGRRTALRRAAAFVRLLSRRDDTNERRTAA